MPRRALRRAPFEKASLRDTLDQRAVIAAPVEQVLDAHPLAAAYAGLAPVTRRSGISIPGEHPPRSGNKHLKRALFLSAFAALRSDPVSRAYYDRKRAEANDTTPPSSASPGAAPTSSTP